MDSSTPILFEPHQSEDLKTAALYTSHLGATGVTSWS
jgi:hypothetical protein